MLMSSQWVLIADYEHHRFCLYTWAHVVANEIIWRFEMSLSPPLSSPSLPFPSFFSLPSLLSILHCSIWQNLQSTTTPRYITIANWYSISISLLENDQHPFSFNLHFVSEYHNIRKLLLVSEQKFNLAGSTLLKYFSKIATTWPKS